MRFKRQLNENRNEKPENIIPESNETDNKKIDQYGETVVRTVRNQKKALSQEEINLIISSYQSGKTIKELAEQFHRSKNTISNLLKGHGVEIIICKAQAKINPEVVISMYAEMHTLVEIGQKFGVNPEVISNCLRDHGIEIRSGRWDYEEKKR